MRNWLARLLFGLSEDEFRAIRRELEIERKLRERLERDLARAQTGWANAAGERNRLLAKVSELRRGDRYRVN